MKHPVVFSPSYWLRLWSFPDAVFRRPTNRYEPPYPHNLLGWKYREADGVGILGEFVLKKGQSTNNWEVEIKVVDLIPADPCAEGGALTIDRVQLQFIRMSDKKPVCEDTYPAMTGHGANKLDQFWINGVGVKGINIRDQWVHFFLTGAEKERDSK